MNDEKMSRRVFLAKSGKAVGLGLLAHFTLIGSLKANDSEGPGIYFTTSKKDAMQYG